LWILYENGHNSSVHKAILTGEIIVKRLFYMTAAMLALTMGAASARSILFIGNSFTFGALSPVHFYQANTVHDLNPPNDRGQTVGGIAAIFKEFTKEAGLDYDVSIETVGGKNFDFHYTEKLALLDRPWDDVVMQAYSQLNKDKPGDPSIVTDYGARLDKAFHAKNPNVRVWFNSTWSRRDYTSAEIAPWKGTPIDQMAKDVHAGFEAARAASPDVAGIIPVGLAWNRAWATGVADSDPTDGIAAGQVNLWANDSQHGSSYGYILATLVIFGQLTGRDPMSLGDREHVATDLGVSGPQMHALEQVAHDELAAEGVKLAMK
jgi:hypothetical protein